MAVTRKDIAIGRSVYYVRKFEPFLSLKILGDLQRRFLGPVASFLEAKEGESLNFSLLVQGISRVSSTMDGDTLVELTRRILDSEYISVMIDNEPAEKLTENILNRAVDNVGEVIELLAFVLKENYENVFTLVRTHTGMGRANGESQLAFFERT